LWPSLSLQIRLSYLPLAGLCHVGGHGGTLADVRQAYPPTAEAACPHPSPSHARGKRRQACHHHGVHPSSQRLTPSSSWHARHSSQSRQASTRVANAWQAHGGCSHAEMKCGKFGQSLSGTLARRHASDPVVPEHFHADVGQRAPHAACREKQNCHGCNISLTPPLLAPFLCHIHVAHSPSSCTILGTTCTPIVFQPSVAYYFNCRYAHQSCHSSTHLKLTTALVSHASSPLLLHCVPLMSCLLWFMHAPCLLNARLCNLRIHTHFHISFTRLMHTQHVHVSSTRLIPKRFCFFRDLCESV
jgi:hypothetical protein